MRAAPAAHEGEQDENEQRDRVLVVSTSVPARQKEGADVPDRRSAAARGGTRSQHERAREKVTWALQETTEQKHYHGNGSGLTVQQSGLRTGRLSGLGLDDRSTESSGRPAPSTSPRLALSSPIASTPRPSLGGRCAYWQLDASRMASRPHPPQRPARLDWQ